MSKVKAFLSESLSSLAALVTRFPKATAIVVVALLLTLGVVGVACAQTSVSSTRETPYDWACCDDAACTTSTSHQRFDTAFVACMNRTLVDGRTRWVQGGKYRLGVTVATPPPAPDPTPAPPPAGTVTLRWNPPTTNSDGSPLTNLAGYRVYYWTGNGTPLVVVVPDAGARTTEVPVPTAGTWQFELTAFNAAAVESARSARVSTVVQ